MNTRKTERDLWSMSGMTVAATSAAVASFSGLRGLASAAGWPEHLAWLLPVTVDAYAMTSTRLWLAGRGRHRRARRFAAANALGAIAGSVAGNAIYHAVSTGLWSVTWPIVVSVGAVPAAVLGLIAHLHALHTDADAPDADLPDDPETEEGDVPEDRPDSGREIRLGSGAEVRPGPPVRTRRPARKRPKYRTESELLEAARAADRRHRVKHGRPISRDALRCALKISGSRATELRRSLSEAARVPNEKEVANQR